ncbi:MAG: prolyl 4-hydroxylase alpha subunit [Hyperionvirus sp.]|uniref:Prolyl 4-hydroxylase alpha subunit n=1 Tax=Hyperionvirus sp. TaxID=2487770 RepID=A0A3G5AAP2_9VIRU|nr:MAG: prolyl 4-hydroxylase alpha subunit [Hyperionvirus sp.]
MNSRPRLKHFQSFLESESLQQLLSLLNIQNVTEYDPTKTFDYPLGENVVDKTIRNRNKITYEQHNLFNWINCKLVSRFNKSLKWNFALIDNTLDLVKYNKGDFIETHQGFIYHDCKEFFEYTFIICLQACNAGGETIFYSEDVSENPIVLGVGDVIVFKKNTPYENKEIIDGRKIILTGNLLCFPKSLNKEDQVDFVVVKISDKVFTIPVNEMKQNYSDCTYYKFYTFEKKQNPNHTIFIYNEDGIGLTEFVKIYDIIMDLNHGDSRLSNALDYVNVRWSDEKKYRHELHEFINDAEKEIHVVSLDKYYKMLKIFDDSNNNQSFADVLPFQLITLEPSAIVSDSLNDHGSDRIFQSLIIWMGVYNNIFATCDQCLSNLCHSDEASDEDSVQNANDTIPDEKVVDDRMTREDYDAYANKFLPNNTRNQIKLIRDRLHKLSKNLVMIPFCVDELMSSIWGSAFVGKKEDIYQEIRLYIWKYYSLDSIDDVLDQEDINNDLKLQNFIVDIINSGEGTGDQQSPLHGKLKKESSELKQDNENIESRLNKKLLDRLDINQVIQKIMKIDTISRSESNFVKERFDANTDFGSYNIVYKLGFIKIAQDAI